MTYIVDLTRLLKLLFDITLNRMAQSSGTTTWSELKGAFEEYEGAGSRQRIHRRICEIFQQDQHIPDPDSFHRVFYELVNDERQVGTSAPAPNLYARQDVSVPPSLAFFCCPDFAVPLPS
jgi:hypothetical protein